MDSCLSAHILSKSCNFTHRLILFMKKLLSLFGLVAVSFGLFPNLSLAYSGVESANTDAEDVRYCNYTSMLYFCSDQTADAADDSADDVYLPETENDAIYFGFSETFDGVSIDVSTSADGYDPLSPVDTNGGSYDWEYWNGTDWVELEAGFLSIVTYDLSNGSDDAMKHTWVKPSDWAMTTVSGSSSLYFARMRATADYSDTAMAAEVGLIVYNLKVVMRDEFGDPISDMEEADFEITGGSGVDDTVYAFEEIENGTYGFALDAPTSSGSEYTISTFPSGFVARDPARSGIDLDFDEYEYESEDNAYSHVIEAVNEAGAEVTILSAIAGLSDVECVIDGAEAYCAVDMGDDGSGAMVDVYSDGYIPASQAITNRVSGSGQEREAVTVEYAYIATVQDMAGNAITDAVVMAGEDFDTTCYYLGSGEYGCAIPTADTDSVVQISADGYETLESTFSSDRTDHTDAQVTSTFKLDEGESEPETELDSDGDGISDEAEEATGTDPLDPEDYLADAEDYDVDCDDPFTDTAGNFAENAICILYDEGVVQGRSSTLFEPSDSITRAEFLKIALLNAGLTITPDSSVEYSDVDPSDWFYSYVTYATAEGFVEGYEDGDFRPNAEINRAEAMVMMMRIAEVTVYDVTEDDLTFRDVEADDWYAWAVVTASENGISEGYSDGTFRPNNSITRAEVAVIARRVWHVYFE